MSKFHKGDKVIGVGCTTSKEGVFKKHYNVFKVIAVGKYDLLLEDINASFSKRNFKLSKSRCMKIVDNYLDITADKKEPALGNLVLSPADGLIKNEELVGVLFEVSDVPGRQKVGTIMVGDQFKHVPYDNLLILED